MIVNESIDLTTKSILDLARCSYYFLKGHLPGFSADRSLISDESLRHVTHIPALYEVVGNLFLEQIEGYWVIELAQGDCIVNSVRIASSARDTLAELSSEGTLSLIESIWPTEFNSRREACWIIGNILTNEVIVSVVEEVVAQEYRQAIEKAED